MNRRHFISQGLLATGSLAIQGPVFSKPALTRLTILHTNDVHSRLDPFPMDGTRNAGMGGIAARAEIIRNIRAQEANVLLLDAGDIFQGTPYFNKYGGVLEMKLMTELGYDVATMGNHDFDAGLDGFLKAKQHAKFPFVCANYDFSQTILNEQTVPHVILKKGKITVGIFGVGVELKGLVPDAKFGETVYLDPIKTANTQATLLKKKGCDLIICLSHLGYEYADDKISDRRLARETKNIHLILGGHTHTFLEKPTEEKNLDGQTVLINQVGWGGLQVGRLDFEIASNCFAKKIRSINYAANR
jgi:5'-nucleotidase